MAKQNYPVTLLPRTIQEPFVIQQIIVNNQTEFTIYVNYSSQAPQSPFTAVDISVQPHTIFVSNPISNSAISLNMSQSQNFGVIQVTTLSEAIYPPSSSFSIADPFVLMPSYPHTLAPGFANGVALPVITVDKNANYYVNMKRSAFNYAGTVLLSEESVAGIPGFFSAGFANFGGILPITPMSDTLSLFAYKDGTPTSPYIISILRSPYILDIAPVNRVEQRDAASGTFYCFAYPPAFIVSLSLFAAIGIAYTATMTLTGNTGEILSKTLTGAVTGGAGAGVLNIIPPTLIVVTEPTRLQCVVTTTGAPAAIYFSQNNQP